MAQQLLINVTGDADAAGFGEGLGVLIRHERAPHLERAAADERTVAVDAGLHLLELVVQEHRLEILGGCVDLVLDVHVVGELRSLGVAERLQRQTEIGGAGIHHITSMSPWMAPAALIACRVAMRSRGPMPSALGASTICCSDTPSRT